MDFGSNYVYDYDGLSEEESFSEDEFYTPMAARVLGSARTEEAEPVAAAEQDVPEVPPATSSNYVALVDRSAAAPPAEPAPAAPRRNILSRLTSCVLGTSQERARQAPREPRHARRLYANLFRGRARGGRRADTNVVAVKFNTLTEPSDMHTGDVVRCATCDAVLSHFTKLRGGRTEGGDDNSPSSQQIWKCEFCNSENPVDIEEEEIPTVEDVTYMLAPAPASAVPLEPGQDGTVDQSIIVFCVDISGSMCVTTEVPGRFRLRGNSATQPGRVAGDSHDQFMPGQNRDVTYVSRLQAVQAAVNHQLEEMKEKFPDRRVALVAFNNEVKIFGSTDSDEVHITGDKLNNKEALLELGKKANKPGAVKDVATALSEKLFTLEEDGATALGPALVVSIALAGQAPGSKVIICTDGLANIGLGNLEGITPETPDKMSEAQEFYTSCGGLAKETGVSVSVVTIEGNRCRTLELGSVADATGGAIDTVDPLHLTERFGSILSNPVIATNVTAKLMLHNKLYVRLQDRPDDHSMSFIERHVGNVTKETEITFEYGVKADKSRKKKKQQQATDAPDAKAPKCERVEGASAEAEATETSEPTASAEAEPGAVDDPPVLMIDGKESVPFQLVITYTSREGAQSMRVITQAKPVTKNREEAEREIQVGVVGSHHAHQYASAVITGEYTAARSSNLSAQRLLHRNRMWTEETGEGYDRYLANMAGFDHQVLQAQSREAETHNGRTYSDDEGDMDDEFLSLEATETFGYDDALAPAAPAPAVVAGASSSAVAGASSSAEAGASSERRKAKKKGASRRTECEDETATFAYKMKGASSKMFK